MLGSAPPAVFTPRPYGHARPGKGAVVGAVLLHLLLVVAIASSAMKGAQALPDYKVYRVDIYSPPPQVEGEPEAAKPQPAIVKAPQPKQVAVEKKPAPVKAPPKK